MQSIHKPDIDMRYPLKEIPHFHDGISVSLEGIESRFEELHRELLNCEKESQLCFESNNPPEIEFGNRLKVFSLDKGLDWNGRVSEKIDRMLYFFLVLGKDCVMGELFTLVLL